MPRAGREGADKAPYSDTLKTSLVLAATSFVGRHLCRRLDAMGVACQATSRHGGGPYLTCDLTDSSRVEAVLAQIKPACIIQCAGATGGADRTGMDRLHVDGTRGLLEAIARVVPRAKVMLFGSAAEYCPVEAEALPVREDYPCRPQSDFGQSKLAQLEVAREAARRHGLQVLVVRPFNILGPGLGDHYLAASLCRRLREARRRGESGPIAVANGRATRDWVDVRDVVEAILALMEKVEPAAGDVGVFNIATGQETTVLELAEELCRLAGPFHAVDAGTAASRSDIQRSAGDATKLRAATGWTPRIAWRQSVADLWYELAASA